MNRAGIDDLFQIVILIIVFIGPAILKMFGAAKKKLETSMPNQAGETTTSSQLDLNAWLQSLTQAGAEKIAPKAVKKKRIRREITSKRKRSVASHEPSAQAPVQQAPFQQQPSQQAPSQHAPVAHKEADAVPALSTAQNNRTIKKTSVDTKQGIKGFLRGPSRKNAVILGEILGKPHGLRT